MESFSLLEVLSDGLKMMSWIEIWAVITGLIYIILAVRENIWCWLFGIISSALSIYLFYTGKLYAESILYIYYVLAGVYGWYAWNKKKTDTLEIHSWTWKEHSISIGLGIVLALSLAFILQNYTDAKIPTLDAFTTVFSFIATYMTTRKVLENWLYWILIDLVTIGMYFYRAYYLYALLMIVYTILAVVGYFKWKALKQKKTLAVS